MKSTSTIEKIVKSSGAILLGLCLAISFSSIIVTAILNFLAIKYPGFLDTVGIRNNIMIIPPLPFVPVVIAAGLMYGLPAAFPLVAFIHWRHWESFFTWLIVGLLGGVFSLCFMYVFSTEGANDRFFHDMAPVFCSYSVVSSLIYGLLAYWNSEMDKRK